MEGRDMEITVVFRTFWFKRYVSFLSLACVFSRTLRDRINRREWTVDVVECGPQRPDRMVLRPVFRFTGGAAA